MSDPLRHVKPAVRSLAAYGLAARSAPVKLNQNENPYDVPAALKRRVLEHAAQRPWSRYPEFEPRELKVALAAFAGWRDDGLLVGNGSNELIEALLRVIVGPGTAVVVAEPTFTLYALLTRILGGALVTVPLDAELQYDAAAMGQVRSERGAPLTIVCSPNNPTGGVMATADVGRLCQAGDGIVVVDEAYHEFSGESVVPLLERHANLIVLRTFSKAMGLAGLRLGYLLCAPELAREVAKAKLPYNVNFFSQAAALAALDEREALGSQVARLVSSRESLFAELREVPGVRPFPSRANFILFELASADPKSVFEALYARGILVRDVTAYPRLERCLRVSVGSEDENKAFLAALQQALRAAEPAVARGERR